jgi:hypothetical protein
MQKPIHVKDKKKLYREYGNCYKFEKKKDVYKVGVRWFVFMHSYGEKPLIVCKMFQCVLVTTKLLILGNSVES